MNATDARHEVTWQQALAWRMRRHHLIERAAASDLLRVTGDICGLHAQLMSSAELSVWARVDGLQRGAVDEAVWSQRALVKLWAMRGTLHLLPSTELGMWLAALGTYTNRGMTGHPEIDELCEAVERALAGRVLTREALASEVERVTGSQALAEMVRFSWGSYIKPASFRGRLCFGPSEGASVTFTSPATWVPGGIDTPDSADALRAVTRRFLAAYAPATAADLALWWGGFGPAPGRRMLAALGDEVVEIDLEGERAFVLTRDLPSMASATIPDTARLLPAFDPWVAGASRDAVAPLAPQHKARVYRPQGWLSPVLLVNGRMVGVWKHARKGRRLLVEIDPFDRLPAWAREQLAAEAERLAELFDCSLGLEWQAVKRAG
ncbi:MAG TPA: winged helix DNA-binding domain-containing protein [Thermomicrobiales bacterium]|nr:winged helix DNA-binding domain-containing protein [Thermomicrobiales bacterium]